ncbi:bactofilin family protein [Cohnella cellulosilytica]|uniref:Polymer-forming cytoskeletal protein n=1 Tax=Cohnella cellulosilytica TaxID=986710 RepID=A0ABW2F465_9BACL
MFKSKKSKIDPNMTDTLIGEGTAFEGKIKSEAGLRVEGQMEGDIDCAGDVTIGENGIARSHIQARNIVIAGKVVGNVAAAAKLTIKSTGRLNGNLSALELSIESGGIFHGTSRMNDGAEAEAAAASEDRTSVREPEGKSASAQEGEAVAVLKTW